MNTVKFLWILTGITALSIVGILSYFLGTQIKKTELPQTSQSPITSTVVKDENTSRTPIIPTHTTASQADTVSGIDSGKNQITNFYVNSEYGFSLKLPVSWKGYLLNISKVNNHNYSTVEITHPTEKIYPPSDFPTTSKPISKTYSFIVVPIATWNEWYVTGEGAHPFAAGVGAFEFGRNSKYVFAFLPRYSYGAYVYGENATEVNRQEGETITRSFNFSEPSLQAQKTNIDWQKEWQKYLPNDNFLEMKDITRDGVPEVLVNSFIGQGASGTSVSKVLIFTIKNSKAVEIPVYENGVKRELSQYSGNVHASRVLFTNDGVEEQQRRSNGLNPGVYEILERKTVFTYNKNTGHLESFVSSDLR